MCNLEHETYTTMHSSSIYKLKSQLTFPMASVLEWLILVQAVVATLSSISWLLMPRLPIYQPAWL